MDFNKLSYIQLDVLRELGNIGAGNAATSMSKLINKKIDMQVPTVKIVEFSEVMELLGGSEQLIVAIFFRIIGDAPGTVYFVLSIEEAEELIRQLTMDPDFELSNGEIDNELASSVLQEVGNILAGSYLSALSDFIQINLQPSIPYLSIDMAGAILSVGLIELSQVTDYAIVIDTQINEEDAANGVFGQFILLPDVESIPKIFSALGIQDYE